MVGRDNVAGLSPGDGGRRCVYCVGAGERVAESCLRCLAGLKNCDSLLPGAFLLSAGTDLAVTTGDFSFKRSRGVEVGEEEVNGLIVRIGMIRRSSLRLDIMISR